MKVSLNTVKQFTAVNVSVEDLIAKINAQLGGVESVTELGSRYEGATIVKIAKCEKHPNADKLSVCMVDDGSGELIQVVCGAPNVRAGIFAVWLRPGMIVPSTADDDTPFVLGSRELRGIVSNGMLAAGDELAINSDHDGIIEISERDVAPGKSLNVGDSFAATFDLDDTIIEIENKMFTHRPDLFGQLGVAREIAGILGQDFTDPDWYWEMPRFADAEGLDLTLFNEAENVPRLMAVTMKNVTIAPSPLWLQTTLLRWGGKAINNVVDMTNYIMLLTAQPTHAYDYDKLRGSTLGARLAKSGEKITLLNGKSYELNEADIVMADGEGAVGLGGVMGGGDSEVDSQTKNIVLEVATFDMYAVRKSAMRHGVFTDALTRFNKGQSPLQNDRVLAKLLQDMSDTVGAVQAGAVHDSSRLDTTQYERGSITGPMQIKSSFINQRLGLSLSSDEVCMLLGHVHFVCRYEGDDITVAAPFWRTDIEYSEDIVEEVGRLYGFDRLPKVLPARSAKPVAKNHTIVTKQRIRETMRLLGANEVVTYSFVHEKVLSRAEQKSADAFKLSNALSPDLQYYRLSVLPSLLDKVHSNIKSGYKEFVLFEIGKGHNKQNYDGDSPAETDLLDIVYAAKQDKKDAAFYQLRRIVAELSDKLNIPVQFVAIEHELDYPGAAMFDYKRSALITTLDGTALGIVGEFKQSVQKNFKLPTRSAGASLNVSALETSSNGVSEYEALSRYPSVHQDISIRIEASIEYAKLLQCATNTIKNITDDLRVVVSPVAIYQPNRESEKTITLRFTVTSHTKTLTDADVKVILDTFGSNAEQQLSASVI